MTGKEIVVIVLGTISGFVGGSFSTGFRTASAASSTVIQASKFELLDESGKLKAVLGPDGNRGVVLSFLGPAGKESLSFGVSSKGSPFFDIRGSDAKVRATLRLNENERPYLVMSDESWQGRAVLGVINSDISSPQDDWGLIFRAPTRTPDLASIGVIRNPADGSLSGSLFVRNVKGKTWSAP